MSMVNEKPCSFLIRTDGRRNALALRRLEFCTAADTALLQELNHETRIQRLAGWNKRKSSLRLKKIWLYCTLGGYLNRKMGTAIFFD